MARRFCENDGQVVNKISFYPVLWLIRIILLILVFSFTFHNLTFL